MAAVRPTDMVDFIYVLGAGIMGSVALFSVMCRATMSHGIRTPLKGVLGMAQAMAGDALSTAQRSRLDVVRQSGESLLTILNDILDLSKIEAGKLQIEQADFDLTEVAQGAYATFEATAGYKGGFDGHVSKPIEVGKLLAAMEAALADDIVTEGAIAV